MVETRTILSRNARPFVSKFSKNSTNSIKRYEYKCKIYKSSLCIYFQLSELRHHGVWGRISILTFHCYLWASIALPRSLHYTLNTCGWCVLACCCTCSSTARIWIHSASTFCIKLLSLIWANWRPFLFIQHSTRTWPNSSITKHCTKLKKFGIFKNNAVFAPSNNGSAPIGACREAVAAPAPVAAPDGQGQDIAGGFMLD